jgi:hypothetical protein
MRRRGRLRPSARGRRPAAPALHDRGGAGVDRSRADERGLGHEHGQQPEHPGRDLRPDHRRSDDLRGDLAGDGRRPKKIDDTLLSRVAPDRLAGNGLEIIAPPGKNYRLMVRQTSRGFKWPVYLRPVDAIGAPYDAPTPEAIREGFTGDWSTPSGILRIVRKFDRLEGTYQGRTAYTSPMTLVGEQVSWNTGGDSENNVDIILSPDAQELQFIRRNAISGVRNGRPRRWPPVARRL